MVEAAFAIPIFLLIVMALVDLGSGVLQTSQVSSAAADGARAAIIWRAGNDQPDVAGSTSRLKVQRAIAGRLVGRTFTFDARCLDQVGATVACRNADPDTARVRVTVRSEFLPVSPIGHTVGEGRILTSSAAMGLVRQPDDLASTPSTPPTTSTTSTTSTTVPASSTTVPGPTSTTLPPCAVLAVSGAPNPIPVNGSGKVMSNIVFTVQTNGGCGVVTVELNGLQIPTGQNGSTYAGNLGSGARIDPGTYPVLVLVNDIVVFTGTIDVRR